MVDSKQQIQIQMKTWSRKLDQPIFKLRKTIAYLDNYTLQLYQQLWSTMCMYVGKTGVHFTELLLLNGNENSVSSKKYSK